MGPRADAASVMDFLATPLRRRVLFAALYLSEGAPIGFLWLALPTWLRVADVPIERITAFTALLVVPWTFKFAWAPLVDVLRGSRWTLKQWIISAQCVMAGAMVPLFWLDLRADFSTIVSLLLVHALAAATQDVAIDALCISVTDLAERGRLNGWMQTGMLLGRAMFGGGALLMAARIGNQAVTGLLIATIAGSMLLLAGSRPPAAGLEQPLRERAIEVWREFVRAAAALSTWQGLLFAFLGGAAFKSLEVVLGPFLVDRGYSKEEIGLFTMLPMIGLMVLGALSGGWLADRISRRLCVALSLLSFVLPIAMLAGADWMWEGERGAHLLTLLAATAFGIGVFTAASYALFMDLTRRGIAATQFSAFMGATNGCESWSSLAVGQIIAASSYSTAFLAMCGASLLALPLLWWMRSARDDEVHPTAVSTL